MFSLRVLREGGGGGERGVGEEGRKGGGSGDLTLGLRDYRAKGRRGDGGAAGERARRGCFMEAVAARGAAG